MVAIMFLEVLRQGRQRFNKYLWLTRVTRRSGTGGNNPLSLRVERDDDGGDDDVFAEDDGGVEAK
jgi:hypothetical protein